MHLEACDARRHVDGADVDDVEELAGRALLEEAERRQDAVRVHTHLQLAPLCELHRLHIARQAGTDVAAVCRQRLPQRTVQWPHRRCDNGGRVRDRQSTQAIRDTDV